MKIKITTSWDDGHVLDLKLVDLLERYGIKGTFYISPKNREFPQKKLLTDAQVMTLSKKFEIGAHTMTHPRLSKVSPSESIAEIEDSKKYLERLIKKPVVSFCYPGGDYNQTHINQVKKADFKIARTTKRFSTKVGNKPFEIQTTIHAYRHYSDIFAIAKLSNYNPIKFVNYYFNWDNLAIAIFDRMLINGGVFHLWGHSWEIDKNRDWRRLENVLKHIQRRKNTSYLTNGELI